MYFDDFVLWMEDNNKAEFRYNGKYYNFIFNISDKKDDYFYAILFNGHLTYFKWIFEGINDMGIDFKSVKASYIEQVQNMVIEGVSLRDIINKHLYEEGSLRKIHNLKNNRIHRNINTIAELLILNYMNMDAGIHYKNVNIFIGGSIDGDCITDPQNKYYDLHFGLNSADSKTKENVQEITCQISLTENYFISFDDIDSFYIYLNHIKIENVFLKNILEDGLFEGVEMAI